MDYVAFVVKVLCEGGLLDDRGGRMLRIGPKDYEALFLAAWVAPHGPRLRDWRDWVRAQGLHPLHAKRVLRAFSATTLTVAWLRATRGAEWGKGHSGPATRA